MNSIPVVEIESSTELKTKTTQTTCPYCGVDCGVTAHVTPTISGPKVTVEGDANHPSNFGKLCIKGSNLADTLGLETRLLHIQCYAIKTSVNLLIGILQLQRLPIILAIH